MKKFIEDNLKEIINKQFEINWYVETYDDVKKDKKWLDKFETTKELETQFLEWLKEYLKPYCSNKLEAEKEIGWILLNYWLPRKDYNLWV
jgi:hypothetical protein